MADTKTEHQPSTVLKLRALAHPLRWRLIDLIEIEGSATATRCAEELDESVASCSYHLGILSKYGYVEQVPRTAGREKPWRLTSTRQDLSAPTSGADEELAAQAAGEAFLDHELERMKIRLRSLSLEPPEWRDACAAGGSMMFLTAEELHEIKDELMSILLRFEDRQTNPDLRPADARSGRIFFSAYVYPNANETVRAPR
jgi:Helix-turn-helix domain